MTKKNTIALKLRDTFEKTHSKDGISINPDQSTYHISTDGGDELKAVLILVFFSLMNVQDEQADEQAEVVPFTKELTAANDFQGSFHALGILLFGRAQRFVSTIFW